MRLGTTSTRLRYYFFVGILDAKTLGLLQDGKVIEILHKMADPKPSQPTEQTIEVKILGADGKVITQQVVVRKVST